MDASHSDALVFFGATGDLAYKKIFPALQAMVKRGHLALPVIGVAKAGWTLDQLRARARESIEKHGSFDPAAFAKRSALLGYVDGDYNDAATYRTLRQALGPAVRPAHYLAIPPVLFGTVVQLDVRCRDECAVIVEKPSGRTGIGAGSAASSSRFPEAAIFRIDHYLETPSTACYFRFTNAFMEPFWNRRRRSRDGGEDFGIRGRAALRRDGYHPRRGAEPPVPGPGEPDDGAARPDRQRVDPRRRRRC
jgi:glucose-6-phosphate 1-dehydrogenase